MNKIKKTRRSRPRTFDRDQAVDTAMRLFWRHGYEGVSLNDLTAAIGVAPPSIYAAFGSKADLYREALDHYFGLPGAVKVLGTANTLEESVERLLRSAVDAVIDPAGERGCMISSGMIQCSADHAELARELAARRSMMHCLIADGLRLWLDQERSVSLARYLVTILQGLSVQARDGASREELMQVCDETIAGLKARGIMRSSDG